MANDNFMTRRTHTHTHTRMQYILHVRILRLYKHKTKNAIGHCESNNNWLYNARDYNEYENNKRYS